MPILYLGLGILLMFVLMLIFKFNAFFSLIITSVFVGLLNHMSIAETLQSILIGVGSTMGKVMLIICLGAMLGKLIEESGAAYTITSRLTSVFGVKKIQLAIILTGFLVGLPMMYNASFLVLIPLVYTMSVSFRVPLLYIGIPLSATLSIAHGFLPPHPAPTYVSFIYHADINKVLLYGLIAMVPSCLISGVLFSRFFKHLNVAPPIGLYEKKDYTSMKLPGLSRSIGAAILPVLLMLSGAMLDMLLGVQALGSKISNFEFYRQQLGNMNIQANISDMLSAIFSFLKFVSDANIALLISVVVAIFLLGKIGGRKISDVMKSLEKSVSPIAMILLIIAAGGAFSQVLIDSQITQYISDWAKDLNFNPIVLAFTVAAIIRFSIGSATVATLTAAPLVAPLGAHAGVSPELMVLSTGAGSIMLSHFNDSGFWMFKEYYNVSVKQTFAIWTTLESLIGLTGLATALVLHYVVHV